MEKNDNHRYEFPARHIQHGMEDAEAVPYMNAFFPQIKAAIFIYKTAAITSCINAEAGIVIASDKWFDLF